MSHLGTQDEDESERDGKAIEITQQLSSKKTN
jgi:hypothetical protein